MQFLPGIPEAEAANIIFRYIYDNWINPYPVVNNVERRLGALPILPLPRKRLLHNTSIIDATALMF